MAQPSETYIGTVVYQNNPKMLQRTIPFAWQCLVSRMALAAGEQSGDGLPPPARLG